MDSQLIFIIPKLVIELKEIIFVHENIRLKNVKALNSRGTKASKEGKLILQHKFQNEVLSHGLKTLPVSPQSVGGK